MNEWETLMVIRTEKPLIIETLTKQIWSSEVNITALRNTIYVYLSRASRGRDCNVLENITALIYVLNKNLVAVDMQLSAP